MTFSKLWIAFALLVMPMCAVLPSAAAELEEQAAAEVDSLMEIYEHLHTYPELSYQEKESAALVARELRKLGFEVTEEVGDYGFEGRTSYGVVGVMRNGDGPTVMVRTDIDALPIEEKTGLPYASRAKGVSDSGSEVLVMQACGHDLHMTT
ncbi:MAG: amidohydrolase, partial [Thermoanaerobaculia bacterium]